MRNPVETRLLYKIARVRERREAEGYVPGQDWSLRVRERWPARLRCEISCGPGWHDLFVALNEIIDAEARPEFRFLQVKEKFGQLRCYWSGEDTRERIDQIVEAAERLSETICERCGAEARMRQTDYGYVYASCDEHAYPNSTTVRLVQQKIRTPMGRIRSTKTETDDE